eukprot:SAG31_NODE_2205_length_6195_cov_4.592520_6_plen_95_part_00
MFASPLRVSTEASAGIRMRGHLLAIVLAQGSLGTDAKCIGLRSHHRKLLLAKEKIATVTWMALVKWQCQTYFKCSLRLECLGMQSMQTQMQMEQ